MRSRLVAVLVVLAGLPFAASAIAQDAAKDGDAQSDDVAPKPGGSESREVLVESTAHAFHAEIHAANADACLLTAADAAKDPECEGLDTAAIVQQLRSSSPDLLSAWMLRYDDAGVIVQLASVGGTPLRATEDFDDVLRGIRNVVEVDSVGGRVLVDPRTHRPLRVQLSNGVPTVIARIEMPCQGTPEECGPGAEALSTTLTFSGRDANVVVTLSGTRNESARIDAIADEILRTVRLPVESPLVFNRPRDELMQRKLTRELRANSKSVLLGFTLCCVLPIVGLVIGLAFFIGRRNRGRA